MHCKKESYDASESQIIWFQSSTTLDCLFPAFPLICMCNRISMTRCKGTLMRKYCSQDDRDLLNLSSMNFRSLPSTKIAHIFRVCASLDFRSGSPFMGSWWVFWGMSQLSIFCCVVGISNSISLKNFLGHSQFLRDPTMTFLNAHICSLFSSFFFSSFGKHFEDIVSFLSQLYSDLSILTPWQSVCDALYLFLIFLVTGVIASELTQEEKMEFIFCTCKRMVSLSVHEDNTTIVMTDLFKHMVRNTDERKFIDGKFSFCFVVRASNSLGLNLVNWYPESLSPPS